MVSPGTVNGVLTPPAARRSRRSSLGFTRQQRIIITVVAAALGLLFAYALQRGGRRRHLQRAPTKDGQLPGFLQTTRQQVQQPQLITSGEQHTAVRIKADAARVAEQGSTAADMHANQAEQQPQQQQAVVQQKGTQSQQLVTQQQEKQQQQQQPQDVGGVENERAWFDKLSSEACARAEHLRVCSHRGRLAVEGVPPGSLSAYSVLHKGGVSCHDVDFVQTRDGQLVASHPDDLRAALTAGSEQGRQDPAQLAEWSLAELRAAGADEERFPTADALIKVFAALLEQSGLLWHGGKGGEEAPDFDVLPVLLMDLKGAAFSAETISAVAAAAQAVGVQSHVALFVTDPRGQAAALSQARWTGPLIRGYMDREDPNPPLTPELLEQYTLLGPSIKMADAFFAAAARLGKPVLAWTADTPADLHRALEAGLNAVISNRPLAVRGVLLDWRDRCSERQGRRRKRALL